MNTFEKTLIAGALLSVAGVAGAESPHSFSANVALTTDYVYRGISQADEDPAVQGGFDYAHESGVYLGIWGSNVEQVAASGTIANVELDYYGGIGGELGNGLGWDVGFIYYDYPDVSAFDFWEVYGGLSYTFGGMQFEPTVGFSVAYSDDFFGGVDEALYFNGTLDLSLPQGFGLGASVGASEFDNDTLSTDYVDWKVYLSKEFGGFGFELAYTDSDLDASSLDDGRAIFTVSRSF